MSEYTRKPRSSRHNKKHMPRVLLVVCLMLVVMVGSIAGTVAWLTATSDPVTNTFTVGDIQIDLKETWNTDTNNDKVNDAWKGKVVPGGSESKDPKVTVKAGSEKCYVYVTVENNLVIGSDTVATVNIDSTKWSVVETKGNKTLYRYYTVVDASTADQECAVFTTVSYDGDKITKSNIAQLKDKTIVINSFAHQSDNTTQTVADTAAKAWAFPITTP